MVSSGHTLAGRGLGEINQYRAEME